MFLVHGFFFSIIAIKGIVHFKIIFLVCFSLPQGHPRCRCDEEAEVVGSICSNLLIQVSQQRKAVIKLKSPWQEGQ